MNENINNYQKFMRVVILYLVIQIIYCQLPQALPSIGLLTVTHARNGDFSQIIRYLKRYAQGECYEKMLTQICIIWNNDKDPEEIGIYDNELMWRIPVYFFKTNNNSMNHRYLLPKEASADYYYSLDDDIEIDCGTLQNTITQYLQNNYYFPGLVVLNEVRSFAFSYQSRNQIRYQGFPWSIYFSIPQSGAALMSKHYLGLYYLDLPQFKQLRKTVDELNNCDDIFFFAIVEHFYPEMNPIYSITGEKYKNTNPKIGNSNVKDILQRRITCLNRLQQIFGYIPLRFYNKNSTNLKRNYKFRNMDLIMKMRIRGLNDLKSISVIQREIAQMPSIFIPAKKEIQISKNKEQKQESISQNLQNTIEEKRQEIKQSQPERKNDSQNFQKNQTSLLFQNMFNKEKQLLFSEVIASIDSQQVIIILLLFILFCLLIYLCAVKRQLQKLEKKLEENPKSIKGNKWLKVLNREI